MRDLYSNIDDRQSVIPSVQAASFSGIAINSFGFRSMVHIVNTGALVGAAAFSLKLQESADGATGWADRFAALATPVTATRSVKECP